MSRDVAMAFTAIKKVEGKQTLKTTTFSSCIQSNFFLIYTYLYFISTYLSRYKSSFNYCIITLNKSYSLQTLLQKSIPNQMLHLLQISYIIQH